MNLIEFVKNHLNGTSTETPEGFCPNCWGTQEYEGKFVKAIHQEQIDLNNVDNKQGWVQAYATKHFEGIKLKETEDYYECPSC